MLQAGSGFQPGAVRYGGAMAAHYAAARGLSPETAEAWRAAAAPYFSDARGKLLLDLGCGTGRFAPLLAAWFDARVVGVEPASEMRVQAGRNAAGPRVSYVGGRAEVIPLQGHTCSAAWLMNVIHHVPDKDACGRELARVVLPRCPILVCGAFSGRLDGITLFRFFPGARRVAEQFPSVEEVVAAFGGAGLRFERLMPVTQRTCAGLLEFSQRTRLRADTTLSLMHEAEFAECQAALERAARAEASQPRPVEDTLDLLLFRSSPGV